MRDTTTMRALAAAGAVALAATAALAAPAGAPAAKAPGHWAPLPQEKRLEMFKMIRTRRNVELGALLGFDTAATLKLADRLAPLDGERERLQLENGDLMRQIRAAARGEAQVDAAAVGRKIAANRVELARLEARQLDEVLAVAPPDRAARVLVWYSRFQRRVEDLARRTRDARRAGQQPQQFELDPD